MKNTMTTELIVVDFVNKKVLSRTVTEVEVQENAPTRPHPMLTLVDKKMKAFKANQARRRRQSAKKQA